MIPIYLLNMPSATTDNGDVSSNSDGDGADRDGENDGNYGGNN
jgi:hypothetical protein